MAIDPKAVALALWGHMGGGAIGLSQDSVFHKKLLWEALTGLQAPELEKVKDLCTPFAARREILEELQKYPQLHSSCLSIVGLRMSYMAADSRGSPIQLSPITDEERRKAFNWRIGQETDQEEGTSTNTGSESEDSESSDEEASA